VGILKCLEFGTKIRIENFDLIIDFKCLGLNEYDEMQSDYDD